MKTRKGKYLNDPEDDFESDESSRTSRKSEELGSVAKEDELFPHSEDGGKEDDDEDEDGGDVDYDDEEPSQELLPFLVAQADRNKKEEEEKNDNKDPPHEPVHRRLLASGMTHRHVLNPKTNKFHLVPLTQDALTSPNVDENDQDSRYDDPLPHSNDWSLSDGEEEEREKAEREKAEKKKKNHRSKNAIIELGDSSQESGVCSVTQNNHDEDDEADDGGEDGDKKPAAKKTNEIIELGDSSQDTVGLKGDDGSDDSDDSDDSDKDSDLDKKPKAKKTAKKNKGKKTAKKNKGKKMPAPEPFVPSKEIPLLKYLKVSSKANKTVVERKVYIRHFAIFGIQPYIKKEAMADAALGPEILALEDRLLTMSRNHEAHWKANNIGEWMWSIHHYIEIAEARYGKRQLRHTPKTLRLFKEHIVRMKEYVREKAIIDEAAATGQKRGKYKVGGQPKYAKDSGELLQHMLANKYNGKKGRAKWTSLILKDKHCPDCNDMCLIYDKTQKELKEEYERKKARYAKEKKDWDKKIKEFQPKKGEKALKPPNFPVRHVVCMCMLLHCEHVHTGKGCPKCVDFISHGINIPQTANGDCDCNVCRCNCMTVFPDSQWAQKIREVTEKRLQSVEDDNKQAFQELVAKKNGAMKQTSLRESFSTMGMLASMVNDPMDGIGLPSPGPYPDTFTMDYYKRNNPSTAFAPIGDKKRHDPKQNIVTGSASGSDRNVRRHLDDDIKDELALQSHRILNQPSYSSAETMETHAALQHRYPKSTEVRDSAGNTTSITDMQQQYREATTWTFL